jgi:two-component system cell cycle response regulator CtrA
MRILVIEDDPVVSEAIEMMLRAERMQVQCTDLGEEGVDLARLYGYDAIVVDLGLPDISGFDVIRSIRMAKVTASIIVVSGYAGIEDKVRALGLGADDFMTKPFHRDELAARICALVRRANGHHQSIIDVGNLSMNQTARTVHVDGQVVHLTSREHQMLELLILRQGQTVTKETTLLYLYDGRDEPELKIIDVFLCKIRKKLAVAGWNRTIETVWGRGYTIPTSAAPVLAVVPSALGDVESHQPGVQAA